MYAMCKILKNGKLYIYLNLVVFEKAENVQISATCLTCSHKKHAPLLPHAVV